MQRLELRPFFRLRLTDEREHGVRKDRTLAIESLGGDADVTVSEEMRFDDSFERRLAGGFHELCLKDKPGALSSQHLEGSHEFDLQTETYVGDLDASSRCRRSLMRDD